MKKFLLSFFLIFASTAYAAYQYLGVNAQTISVSLPVENSQNTTTASPSQIQQTPSSPSKTTQNTNTTPKTTPTVPKTPVTQPVETPVATTPKPTGQYKDGTYTSSVVDAYYGPVQIKAVVQGGKLADVIFLQYPNDRRTSVEINQQAMPYLKSEAIQAQSATIDGVSGASQTSEGFKQALQEVLTQAKA